MISRFAHRLQRIELFSYVAASIALFLGIWYAFYRLPFLQHTVQMTHTWASSASLWESIEGVLTMTFLDYPSQPMLSLFVLAGLIVLLRTPEENKHCWIIISAIICLVIYNVSTLPEPNFVKHFLGGFWYADHHRTSAVCVVPLICLASAGLGHILLVGFNYLIGQLKLNTDRHDVMPLFAALALACLIVIIYITQNDSALRSISSKVDRENNSAVNHVFGYDEQQFTEKTIALVGEDALVINYPYDGSMYSYSVYGMRTLYRYDRNYLWETETVDSRLIREHLSEIESNSEVQEAVVRTNAHYVILYDQGEDVYGTRVEGALDNMDWGGILAINAETPGFELVMHEGDMYLYRIMLLQE